MEVSTEVVHDAKTAAKKERKYIGLTGRSLLFLLGVVLPLAALLVEVFCGFCAGVFFNPVPTLWHGLLIALVPAVNFWAAWPLKRDKLHCAAVLGLLQGAAAGVSVVYAILFLPLLPQMGLMLAAAVPTLLFGNFLVPVLLLPFAPALSLAVVLIYRARLKRGLLSCSLHARGCFAAGVVLGLVGLAALEFPRTFTRLSLEQLIENPSDLQTLQRLRAYGAEGVLLQAAYAQENTARGADQDFVEWLQNYGEAGNLFFERNARLAAPAQGIKPAQARQIYYLVTGRPFNAVPKPAGRRPVFLPGLFGGDPDLGETRTGGIADGLTLAASMIDSSVNGGAAVSYTEWALVFRNSSAQQQEARLEMLLPPGGVVSRATLWVDGDEREAVIGEKGKVRAAYQRVVQARRDPLLVTYAGPDRVTVQCFPVPPRGGEMKIRIGITAPLELTSLSQARFGLPSILEKNFEIPTETKHSVWIESKQVLVSNAPALTAERPNFGVYALRGRLDSSPAVMPRVRVEVSGVAGTTEVRSVEGSHFDHIRQRAAVQEHQALKNLVFVFDGSAGMQVYAAELAAELRKLPAGIGVGALLAADMPVPLTGGIERDARAAAESISEALTNHKYEGGVSNALTLLEAWEWAGRLPDAAVIWMHGPQPVVFPEISELARRNKRRPHGPRIFSLQLAPGPDRVAAAEELWGLIEEVPAAAMEGGPVAWVSHLTEPFKEFKLVREIILPGEIRVDDSAMSSSPHLARLWAAGRVQELASVNQTAEAVELAARYGLVTAVSAAVVLESDGQYQEAGLDMPNGGNVPVIPEPEMYALLLALCTLMALYQVRGKAGWYVSRY